MLLAAESHQRLEAFLREHFRRPTLRLPPLYFYGGRFAGWLTRSFHIGAITFGRHIFVLPDLIERSGEGRLTVPGWLAAHEATHVLQFERAGVAGFLITYLRGYWRALRSQKRWDAKAHMQAYLTITEECDAREAEKAYTEWRKGETARPEENENVALSSHPIL
jgi:hypothetical protein